MSFVKKVHTHTVTSSLQHDEQQILECTDYLSSGEKGISLRSCNSFTLNISRSSYKCCAQLPDKRSVSDSSSSIRSTQIGISITLVRCIPPVPLLKIIQVGPYLTVYNIMLTCKLGVDLFKKKNWLDSDFKIALMADNQCQYMYKLLQTPTHM